MSSEAKPTSADGSANDPLIEKKDSGDSGDSSSGMGSFVDAGMESDSSRSGNDFSLVQEDDAKSSTTSNTGGAVEEIVSGLDKDDKSEAGAELLASQSTVSHFTTASQATTHHTNTSSRFFGDVATSKSDLEEEKAAAEATTDEKIESSSKNFHKSLDEWEKFKISLLKQDEEEASKTEMEEDAVKDETEAAPTDDKKDDVEVPKIIQAETPIEEKLEAEELEENAETLTEVVQADESKKDADVDADDVNETVTTEEATKKDTPEVESTSDVERVNPFESGETTASNGEEPKVTDDIEDSKDVDESKPEEIEAQSSQLPGWLLPFAASRKPEETQVDKTTIDMETPPQGTKYDPYAKPPTQKEETKTVDTPVLAPTIVTPPINEASPPTDREIEMQEMGQKSRGVLPIPEKEDSYVNISSTDVVGGQTNVESSTSAQSVVLADTYSRYDVEKPSAVNSSVTKSRPFNLERFIIVAVVAMVGGFFGTVYSTTSCEYATVFEPVGENQVLFEAHYGLWQYTTIDSVFMGYSYCTAYHSDDYGTSPNAFAPLMGLMSTIAASYTIAVIWVYLFFMMHPTSPGWSWAIRGAMFAALCQLTTLTFFMNDICDTYECTAGPGSFSAIISALSWLFVAHEMKHNSPSFDDTNIESRSCLGKITYNIGIRMQPKGKTELQKVQELSSYQAPTSNGVSA